MLKKKGLLFFYLFAIIVVIVFCNINFSDIYSLPENFSAGYQDIENVNQNKLFGRLVKTSLQTEQKDVSTQKDGQGTIIFKLFGFIPIRKVTVNILPEEEVYLGGVPIGLSLTADGAIVISDTVVSTDGKTVVNKNTFFKNGDILRKIDGQELTSLEEVDRILSESDGQVNVEYMRNNENKKANIKLLKSEEGKYKLGLWVKDDVTGIGTLTYVKQDSHNFAALGHPVTDGKGGNVIPSSSGKIYDCSLLGINKGERNNPGELRCVFLQSNVKGDIVKNTKYGIFGHLDELDGIVDANLTAKIGGRLSVKPGKAKIISSVSGIREEYDIEIIKANYQSKSNDKSMVFRVTDKRLLELTGGIVQGMSGSPILQDGKLVGAVTHVFLSDPTKGYGVYSDWMIESAGDSDAN